MSTPDIRTSDHAGVALRERLQQLHSDLPDAERYVLDQVLLLAGTPLTETDSWAALPAIAAYSGPYPLFAHLRAHDAVHWDTNLNGWLITRYADAVAVEREPRLSCAARYQSLFINAADSHQATLPTFRRITETFLGHLDAPEHTRMRSLFERVVTAEAVNALRPAIERISNDLVAANLAGRRLDVVSDFAYHLPFLVACELLGIPAADQPTVRGACERMLGPMGTPGCPFALWEEIEAHVAILAHYFAETLTSRRARSASRAMKFLASQVVPEGAYSLDEVIGVCVQILVGSYDSVRDVLGLAVLTLLRNPGALAELQDDPSRIRIALEELLRFDGLGAPVSRVATADFEMGEKHIAQGDRVVLVAIAVNRDPAMFSEPDRLDFGRQHRHFAFGVGRHYCPGAPLARAILEIALRTLLQRLPGLRLDGCAPTRDPALASRSGLTALPVAFDHQ